MPEPAPAAVVRPEDHLSLVGVIARALSRGLPSSVELDDLINDGVLGLLDAARRYDPSRGVGFSTYAGHRIRGAMLDGLRARDPLPRRVRRARRRAAAGRQPAAGGVQLVALDEALAVPEDDALGPEPRAVEADLLRRILSGLAALPPRDRQVLTLRLIHGLTLREVGARLALSITRIAEIQARGTRRLRYVVNAVTEGSPHRAGRPSWQECAVMLPNPRGTAARPPRAWPGGPVDRR